MPEHPADPQPGGSQPRALAEIVAELAQLSGERRAEATVLRDAVVELSHAIAHLLDLVREERAEQHGRIAALEAQVGELQDRIAIAEAAGFRTEPDPISGSDFARLREAAEQLRASTEQIVRAQPPPAEEAGDGDAGRGLERAEPAAPAGEPAVLRVFPGARAPESSDGHGPSELQVQAPSDEQADAAIAAAVAGAPADAAPEPPAARPAEEAVEPEEEQTAAQTARVRPPEPLALPPHAARKRKATLRRRRIDARKLTAVEPGAALRAMVAAVEPKWTAGRELDLVIALTDGATYKVSGGKGREPDVVEVDPGTPARCTLTLAGAQVVPVLGRTELAATSSPPLVHGERRDADLLVAWIDRAQRLLPEPLL